MILAIVFCIRLIIHEKSLYEDSCQALILIYVTIVTFFLCAASAYLKFKLHIYDRKQSDLQPQAF